MDGLLGSPSALGNALAAVSFSICGVQGSMPEAGGGPGGGERILGSRGKTLCDLCDSLLSGPLWPQLFTEGQGWVITKVPPSSDIC